MNRMKKLFALVLSLLFILNLTGCNDLWPEWFADVEETSIQTSFTTSEATSKETTEDTSEATSEVTSSETTGATETAETTAASSAAIDEDGSYTHRDDVALYIYTYGHLPHNFITKRDARALGWSSGGLDDYLYEGCIGGDRFGNYEELLPEVDGRQYYECDIDTMHQRSRGPKRIVYSNDGLIYYTEDHYSTFILLYGEP